jgi:hypothetical protein
LGWWWWWQWRRNCYFKGWWWWWRWQWWRRRRNCYFKGFTATLSVWHHLSLHFRCSWDFMLLNGQVIEHLWSFSFLFFFFLCFLRRGSLIIIWDAILNTDSDPDSKSDLTVALIDLSTLTLNNQTGSVTQTVNGVTGELKLISYFIQFCWKW